MPRPVSTTSGIGLASIQWITRVIETKLSNRVGLVVASLVGALAVADPSLAQPQIGDSLARAVAALETRTGGRIGVSVTDLDSGARWSHRATERFPIVSTYKAFACAHLLYLADRGKADPGRLVRFNARQLQTYSPITKDHVDGDGMTLLQLCGAATAMSDNTAANLVLQHTGGPEGLTQFLRSIGDPTTRLDRYEPDLNEVGPGEERDTTSPEAAAASLGKLIVGDVLSRTSRDQLEAWLVADKVGGPLVRASLPKGWRIADRTGAGGFGSRGVIAIVWPEGGATRIKGPVAIAVYLTGTTLSLDDRNAAIADIGAAMVRDLRR